MKRNTTLFTIIIFIISLIVSLEFYSYRKSSTISSIKDSSQMMDQDVDDNKKESSQVLGEYTPSLSISGKDDYGSRGGLIVLNASEEPVIQIASYDLKGKVEVNLYKVDDTALFNYLLHNSEGSQITEKVDSSLFSLVKKFYTDIVNRSTRDSTQNTLLPITESGIYFVHVKQGEYETEGFVMYTHLAVLVKEGNNQFIFWGQDMKTLRSINSGKITLYSLENERKQLVTADFNQEGIAVTDLIPEADLALAEYGDQKTIIPINLQYLGYDYQYKNFSRKSRNATFFVFTDRPLYKPGDTIYFKSVIRDDDDAAYSIPTGTARVKIFTDWDEKNNTIFDKSYTISEYGTIDGEFTLPEDVKTGYYDIKISINDNIYNYGHFLVEYYRKPEYAIDVLSYTDKAIRGDNVTYTIQAKYFSGEFLSNEDIRYDISSGNFVNYWNYGDKDLELSNEYRYGGYWGSKPVIKGAAKTNAYGEIEVDFDTAKLTGDLVGNKNQVVSFEAIKDNSGEAPSFARKNILVYAGEFDIFRTGYERQGKVGLPLTLKLELTPNKEKVDTGGKTLTVKITRENWIPVKEAKKKGYSYKKEVQSFPSMTATSDSKGLAEITITPEKPGYFTYDVSVKDDRGNTIEKTFYKYVVKENEPIYETGKSPYDSMNIDADKESYVPGENARLSVSSTIPDRDIFLSLERDRVHKYAVIKLQGRTGETTIPIEDSYMPNIYVTSSSFSINSLDTESKNLEVRPESKKLFVNIIPEKKTVSPGERTTVTVKTMDSSGNPVAAEVALWAVDKALFELIDENPSTIFDAFWRQKWPNVSSSNSFAGINVYDMPGAGGGCFTGKTEVLIDKDKSKPIEEIKIGDTILTRKNEKSTELVKAQVKGIHKQEDDGYYIFNSNIRVTPTHRLFVNGAWEEAQYIQKGDRLTDSRGKDIDVESVEWQTDKVMVYNLEVEKYGTYFAGGVWVHNQKGGGGPRSVFKDTAYWNPNVRTDQNGMAEVSFTVPDNLTTWVVSAVGTTVDTKVGQVKQDIQVSKSVVIRPVLPNILRIGDTIVLSALAQNFTEKEETFNVSLEFSDGTVANAAEGDSKMNVATQSGVVLKPQESKEIYWRVQPKKENKNAELQFSMISQKNKDLSDIVINKIPVYLFGFENIRSDVGNDSKTYDVKLAEQINPNKSSVTLSLAPSLLGTFPEAMRYLIGYPYGCVEQTVSRFAPAVIAKQSPGLFDEALKNVNINNIIKKGIKRLQEMRNSDGGWSWYGESASDPFLTAYVLEYLLEARELGYDVDEYTTRDVTRFIDSLHTRYPKEREEYALMMYMNRLLNREEKMETVALHDLWTPDIMALAVLTNIRSGITDTQSNGLAKLIAQSQEIGETVYWEAGSENNYGSRDASTALALRALVESGTEADLAAKVGRYLANYREHYYWSNTFGTSQTLRSLAELSKVTSDSNPNYTYTVKMDGKTIVSGSVTDIKQTIEEIKIPIDNIKKDGSKVEIIKDGEGKLFSVLTIKEFINDTNAKAVENGLKIVKTLRNSENKSNIEVGDTVVVELEISGKEIGKHYGVIHDELPSGLVPINRSFKNEQYDASKTYNRYFQHIDYTENGAVISLYTFGTGDRVYTYEARVVSEGEYIVPPATVSLMYLPEIYGRTDIKTLTVSGKSPAVGGGIGEKVQLPGIGKTVAIFIVTALLAGLAVFIHKKRTHLDIIPNDENTTPPVVPTGQNAVSINKTKETKAQNTPTSPAVSAQDNSKNVNNPAVSAQTPTPEKNM